MLCAISCADYFYLRWGIAFSLPFPGPFRLGDFNVAHDSFSPEYERDAHHEEGGCGDVPKRHAREHDVVVESEIQSACHRPTQTLDRVELAHARTHTRLQGQSASTLTQCSVCVDVWGTRGGSGGE